AGLPHRVALVLRAMAVARRGRAGGDAAAWLLRGGPARRRRRGVRAEGGRGRARGRAGRGQRGRPARRRGARRPLVPLVRAPGGARPRPGRGGGRARPPPGRGLTDGPRPAPGTSPLPTASVAARSGV